MPETCVQRGAVVRVTELSRRPRDSSAARDPRGRLLSARRLPDFACAFRNMANDEHKTILLSKKIIFLFPKSTFYELLKKPFEYVK